MFKTVFKNREPLFFVQMVDFRINETLQIGSVGLTSVRLKNRTYRGAQVSIYSGS